MAFLSLDKTHWRDRLQAWWEEYYLDNPLVWALQRKAVRHLNNRMPIPNLRVLPFWTRGRILWAFFWWTVALVGVCVMSLIPTLSQQANQWLKQVSPGVLSYVAVMFIFSLRSNSMVDFLDALRKENQLTAVGMTRLRGAHVVYGGVLHSWVYGTLRRTLIAYYPLLWFIYSVMSGSALVSLFTAAAGVLLWNAIVLVLLLISFSMLPVQLPVREAGAGKAYSEMAIAISVAQVVGIVMVPGGLAVLFYMGKVPFLVLVTPVVWLLVGVLRWLAVRRADRMLRSKEPEIVPSEGRWQ